VKSDFAIDEAGGMRLENARADHDTRAASSLSCHCLVGSGDAAGPEVHPTRTRR
jgi:hypothetical protein